MDIDYTLFRDFNDSFFPLTILEDAAGGNVESVFASECGEKDCDGKVFMMQNVSVGDYTVGMIPSGEGESFTVEMMCSAVSMRDGGTFPY